MRLYMRIPVFLPAVTFSTELTLKWLHTQMFIHMLPKIPSFIETLVTPVIAHVLASHTRKALGPCSLMATED